MYMLPRPYPDEIVGSMLMRAQRQLGLGRKTFLRRLIGVQLHSHSFVMAMHPEVAHLYGYEMPEFLQKHTLLRYQLAFLAEHERQKLISQLMQLQSSTMGTLVASPFKRKVYATGEAIKFCPACVESDLQQYGESYWHRVHQLCAVSVCHMHQMPLWVTEHTTLRQNSPQAPHETIGSSKPMASALSRDLAYSLAVISEKALNGSDDSNIDWIQSYQMRAINLGYVKRKLIDKHRLARDVTQLYDADFLAQYNCTIRSQDRGGWPAKLLNTSAPYTATFKHILLNVFFDWAQAHAQSRK